MSKTVKVKHTAKNKVTPYLPPDTMLKDIRGKWGSQSYYSGWRMQWEYRPLLSEAAKKKLDADTTLASLKGTSIEALKKKGLTQITAERVVACVVAAKVGARLAGFPYELEVVIQIPIEDVPAMRKLGKDKATIALCHAITNEDLYPQMAELAQKAQVADLEKKRKEIKVSLEQARTALKELQTS